MLGRLDRYLLRAALGSFGASLLFIIILFMLMDLMLDLAGYLKAAEEAGLGLGQTLLAWAEFHLMSLPWLFVTVAPFATVISAMFTVSRFMASNEIAPMLFCGRGTMRILAPILSIGVLAAIGMAASWELVVPITRPEMERLGDLLGKDTGGSGSATGVTCRSPVDPRMRLLAVDFDPVEQKLTGVVLWIRGSRPDDMSEVRAASAEWNPELEDWDLTDGFVYSGGRQPRALLGMPGLRPKLLSLARKEAKETTLLSYSELIELQEFRPNWHVYRLAFHSHLSSPLANVILLLLALPLAVSFERRTNKSGRVLLAVLICGIYLAVDLTCQNLGRREYLHPIVAAWTPAILFGSLGLVLFSSMRT